MCSVGSCAARSSQAGPARSVGRCESIHRSCDVPSLVPSRYDAGRPLPLPPPSLITMVSGLSLRRSMLAASTDAKLRRYTIAPDEILNDVRTPGRRCSVVIGRPHRVSSIRPSPVPAPVHRRPLSSGQLGPVPSPRVCVSAYVRLECRDGTSIQITRRIARAHHRLLCAHAPNCSVEIMEFQLIVFRRRRHGHRHRH